MLIKDQISSGEKLVWKKFIKTVDKRKIIEIDLDESRSQKRAVGNKEVERWV